MAITTSKKFNVHAATQFKEGFDESDPSQMYLFYSRIDPWGTETTPPAIEDTVYAERDLWRGMSALKKISNNNITMSVSKYLWETNTV